MSYSAAMDTTCSISRSAHEPLGAGTAELAREPFGRFVDRSRRWPMTAVVPALFFGLACRVEQRRRLRWTNRAIASTVDHEERSAAKLLDRATRVGGRAHDALERRELGKIPAGNQH